MLTGQRKWLKVFFAILIALVILVVLMPVRTAMEAPASPQRMALPSGCTEIHRTPKAVFVSCVVQGRVVYLATLTTKGVTIGAPMKL